MYVPFCKSVAFHDVDLPQCLIIGQQSDQGLGTWNSTPIASMVVSTFGKGWASAPLLAPSSYTPKRERSRAIQTRSSSIASQRPGKWEIPLPQGRELLLLLNSVFRKKHSESNSWTLAPNTRGSRYNWCVGAEPWTLFAKWRFSLCCRLIHRVQWQ